MPTPAELAAAYGKSIPDVIGPELSVLFCGINPGLWSAATGHHFARPGNRFWPALHRAGFTPRQLRPDEQSELLDHGLGITNVVDRGHGRADELTAEEIVARRRNPAWRRSARMRQRFLAVLGIGAYRTAFARRRRRLGLQPDAIGDTRAVGAAEPERAERPLPDRRPRRAVRRTAQGDDTNVIRSVILAP